VDHERTGRAGAGSYLQGAQVYGNAIADSYDDLLESMADETAAAVAFLAELARGGRALELGVGTGRIALPLAARGVRVHGIDASARMLGKLHAKRGGDVLGTTLGDFADIEVPGPFDLVYVVFNTLCALPSQGRQIECVRNVAARLAPGGMFVVEAFVPAWPRFAGEPDAPAPEVDATQARLRVTRHDPLHQTLAARQALVTPAGLRVLPLRLRYVWPSELDLMARLAGLRFAGRFAGWTRARFTAASPTHVSVYSKPPG
jgi:SAM-dependent methyltransferase